MTLPHGPGRRTIVLRTRRRYWWVLVPSRWSWLRIDWRGFARTRPWPGYYAWHRAEVARAIREHYVPTIMALLNSPSPLLQLCRPFLDADEKSEDSLVTGD